MLAHSPQHHAEAEQHPSIPPLGDPVKQRKLSPVFSIFTVLASARSANERTTRLLPLLFSASMMSCHRSEET
jgi:hypothetical protein